MEAGFDQLDITLRCFIEALLREQEINQNFMKSHQYAIVEVVKAESNAQNAATTAIAAEVKKTQGLIEEAYLEAIIREKRQQLLRSLKYDSMCERFDNLKPAAKGTCQWMIQNVPPAPNTIHREPNGEVLPPVCPHRPADGGKVPWSCFPCWLASSKDRIYWVQGKAGSGKSTLMKYLVTNSALWYSKLPLSDSQGPLVLSHFLWAAGSGLPRSLRGILLNILYQLLSNDQHALDHVINTLQLLNHQKETNADWTLEELERTVVSSLKAIGTRPVFMFLDGLDEFGTSNTDVIDDPSSLLDLTTTFSTLTNVKICVSSRPEPVFRKRLGGLCGLRLQDLTRGDMDTYAKARLLSDEVVGLDHQKKYQRLVDKLCDMSDGVFLWTALAVRSLSQGLTNEDDISELYARVEKMPQGLYALYSNMWSRLNEDQHLYQEEAARYFQLRIHWSSMPGHHFTDFSTFHLLVSLDPSIFRAYLTNDKASCPSNLEAACEKLGKRVEIRSAGLLEHGNQGRINFIHRSALEFLTATPEGQKIMAHGQFTHQELRSRLLQADTATAYLMALKPFDSSAFNEGGVLHYNRYNVNSMDLYMEHLQWNWDKSALPGELQIMLLETCKRIAEALQRKTHTHGSPMWIDFTGHQAERGRHNLIIPLVLYPQFSPYAEVIRSRSYRSFLFAAALTQDVWTDSRGEFWMRELPERTRMIEAILAEDALLEFQDPVPSPQDRISSADAGSCLHESRPILADDERTAVLVLLSALKMPWVLLSSPSVLVKRMLSNEQGVLPSPQVLVNNFFRRYPQNEEKIRLQICEPDPGVDQSGHQLPSRDCWIIELQCLEVAKRSRNKRVYEVNFEGKRVRRWNLPLWVIVECDVAYAAKLLTLGWTVREEDTDKNTTITELESDEIWRQPTTMNETDPRLVAFGRGWDRATPANTEDANRVLSKLGDIRLAKRGTSFVIPGLREILEEIYERGNDLHWTLIEANGFNNFVSDFRRSFKELTCSAEHLTWLKERKREAEESNKRCEREREEREEREKREKEGKKKREKKLEQAWMMVRRVQKKGQPLSSGIE